VCSPSPLLTGKTRGIPGERSGASRVAGAVLADGALPAPGEAQGERVHSRAVRPRTIALTTHASAIRDLTHLCHSPAQPMRIVHPPYAALPRLPLSMQLPGPHPASCPMTFSLCRRSKQSTYDEVVEAVAKHLSGSKRQRLEGTPADAMQQDGGGGGGGRRRGPGPRGRCRARGPRVHPPHRAQQLSGPTQALGLQVPWR